MSDIERNYKAARAASGFSESKLSRLCNRSRKTLRRLRRFEGASDPSVKTIMLVSRQLHLSPSEMMWSREDLIRLFGEASEDFSMLDPAETGKRIRESMSDSSLRKRSVAAVAAAALSSMKHGREIARGHAGDWVQLAVET